MTTTHDDWIAAGPLLPEPLRRDVQAVLDRTGALLGVGQATEIRDHAGAAEAMARTWALLREREDASQAQALTAAVQDLHDLHLRLQRLEVERAGEATRLLTRVIARMESTTCSVAGLVELAPQLICELGFDRGLISRVSDGVWYPELMYVMGDPRWAEEITQAGKSEPTRLRPGLHETQVLTTRSAILVTEAQRDPRRGHLAMVEASQTRSYVAAPILSGGNVVGLLHADRYGQHRDVDELDRQMLSGFAEAFRLVLSRAALADELQRVHRTLRGITSTLGDAVDDVHRIPLIRVGQEVRPSSDGLVVRVGARQPEHRPLPDTLTRRELEVLSLMAAGQGNATIAETLVIADGTVKQHVKHILRKLGAGNRSEAVARWFQAGGLTGVSPQG